MDENIGGNELLIDEMIAQSNARKGYITKQEMIRLQVMNITYIAAAKEEEKQRRIQEAKMAREAASPKVMKRWKLRNRKLDFGGDDADNNDNNGGGPVDPTKANPNGVKAKKADEHVYDGGGDTTHDALIVELANKNIQETFDKTKDTLP